MNQPAPASPIGHTPGPWTARAIGYSRATGVAPDVFEVASPQVTIVEAILGPDARLIAAAPDLLDRLTRLIALHDDAVFVCGSDDENKVTAAVFHARRAIAKATGAA